MEKVLRKCYRKGFIFIVWSIDFLRKVIEYKIEVRKKFYFYINDVDKLFGIFKFLKKIFLEI